MLVMTAITLTQAAVFVPVKKWQSTLPLATLKSGKAKKRTIGKGKR